MRIVADREQVAAELVRDVVARGRLIIPANIHHLAGALEAMAIGRIARPAAMQPAAHADRGQGVRGQEPRPFDA